MKKAKFGVFLPFYAFGLKTGYRTFNQVKNFALECERLGYHSIWLDDHLMYDKTPILECFTLLSAISTVTQKIRLGSLVICSSFRHPALLAKIAATLDLISKGRLELGIGACSQREEHISHGIPFPNFRERVERLDEYIEVMKKLWIDEETTFKGRYYRLEKAVCLPKPYQKPHPKIIVGGKGNLILKVAAKHANRYDWGPLPIEEYKRKMSILKTYCQKFGRNVKEIEKTGWLGGKIFIAKNKKELAEKIPRWKPRGTSLKTFKKFNFVGTPNDFIQRIENYMGLGVTFFMLYFGDLPDKYCLRTFAETVVKKL